MGQRIRTGDYRTTPFETRRLEEPRDIDQNSYVPLYLSDSDGEPQPSEYVSPSQPRRRRASISSRILGAVCVAAAVAVLFALFSSDAMRDLVNVKAAMASVTSIFPTPSVAAPSTTPLPAGPSKDPARLASPANRTPAITMANVTPTREEVRNAYQSALQNQAPPPSAAVAQPQVQPQILVQPQVQAAPAPLHRIAADEVAASLKRAAGLIASGDIAAARLVLQRIADDGDAQASVTLAETYDPAILERLGVRGTVPDIAMARQWYETAQKYGSTEASQRLAVLASTNH